MDPQFSTEQHALKDMHPQPNITTGLVTEKSTRDENDMAFFGKRQQLKRRFGFMSIIGLTCTLMITWEGILSVFALGLANGGPSGLIYGYIVVWVGTIFQTLTMAEMASMIPLSGGQYNWVAVLSPPFASKYLSYLTGWVTMIGWQAATTSSTLLAAQMIQGLVVLNFPDYAPEPWQATLIFYAVMAFALFTNTYLASQLPVVEGMVLIVHLLGFLAILIPLVYLAPHGTPSEVFQNFANEGGWGTQGLSFFIGLVTSVFSLLGMDAAAHMAEEIQNASAIIPRSMLATVTVNGTLGFAMLIAVLFCIGNVSDGGSTGFPFIAIFQQATGTIGGATGMTVIILLTQIFAAIGLLASTSRMTWAFARERGIPGYTLLSRVHPKTALPLWSIALTVAISSLLALINIGSSTALNAVLSLVTAGFYSSFLIAACAMLHKRRSSTRNMLRWGPFTLGRFGVAINIISIAYTVIIIFFSFWPSTAQVTPADMNWSILMFGSTLLFSTVFWFVHGKNVYTGPIMETY